MWVRVKVAGGVGTRHPSQHPAGRRVMILRWLQGKTQLCRSWEMGPGERGKHSPGSQHSPAERRTKAAPRRSCFFPTSSGRQKVRGPRRVKCELPLARTCTHALCPHACFLGICSDSGMAVCRDQVSERPQVTSAPQKRTSTRRHQCPQWREQRPLAVRCESSCPQTCFLSAGHYSCHPHGRL